MHITEWAGVAAAKRRVPVLLAGFVVALVLGAGGPIASAGAALGPAPWNAEKGLCPASVSSPLGADTGCEWGIDVTEVNGGGEATVDQIAQDANQGPYDEIEDVTVVIENDSPEPLKSIKLGFEGSGQDDFGFDGDGICSGIYLLSPPCPSLSSEPPGYGYEGPDTSFEIITENNGIVDFPTPLKPGEHTYFSLELSPNTILTDSKVNNFVSTVQEAPEKTPSPYISESGGVNVTDKATIVGPKGAVEFGGTGEAEGTVVYKLFANETCTGAPLYTSAPKAVVAGVAAASDPVGAGLGAGRYFWLVEYSGDGNGKAPEHDTPSTSLCGNEVLFIGSVVTTRLSSTNVPSGTPVTDSATVTGSTAPGTATGEITFTVYTDPTCKNAVGGKAQTVPLTTGAATTAPISLGPGTYYFQATYGGDSKNLPGASACGSEVLTVNSPNAAPPPPPPPPPTNPPVEKRHPFVFVNTGEIETEYEFPEPGQAEDEGEIVEGATLARVLGASAYPAKSTKCKKHYVRKGNRCVNNSPVKFGRLSVTLTKAGVHKFRIKPSHAVLVALKKGKTLNVELILRFTPAGTTTHIVKVTSVKVHLKHKHKKH